MKTTSLAALCAVTAFLTACEKYTEKTSPCFGRDGEPTVTRADLSFATASIATDTAAKDCIFEDLPRPE